MNPTKTQKDTILIVDDIQENVSVLFRFLSNEGFKVLVAQDGEQALRLFDFVCPDVILLDVMMPGMDGFEVCKILKSQEKTQEIPIIFMTALTDTVDKVKGFSLGAADYITKPFQQEEVLARVNVHIKLHKLQQQLQVKNQQLQEQKAELETRNMELEAFCRTVAHDLKNPINVAKGYTEMLIIDYSLGTPLDEDAIEVLQLTAQANDKMVNIIESLLLLAGVAKENDIPKQPLDMSFMISQIIQQRLPLMLDEYQGEIMFHPSNTNDLSLAQFDTWPIALGYAPWIEEIWANYLSNGLKYGGRPPRLEVGAHSQNNDMICFWVRDNGPGLSPEAQTKLFTPFTRLHQDRAEGHGLGLSIVQQIIEKLGGQVGVESTLGQGSLFYFTLPIYSA
jgi:two-component system sensor histidine kinase/response regulator